MTRILPLPLFVLCVVSGSIGCGERSSSSEQLGKVVFARSLGENYEPVDETNKFPTDAKKICLSVVLKGRPSSGHLKAVFRRHEKVITSVSYDLSKTNGGVIASVGQNTVVGFTLTTDKPFPIGDRYDAVLYLNQKEIGKFPFQIVTPANAITSRISKSALVAGDANIAGVKIQAANFGMNDKIALIGRGDFGKFTWIQAEWFVAEKLDAKSIRSLTFQKNLSDQAFRFSFIPAGGWPKGMHKVVLTMNDNKSVTHEFTID